MRKNYQHLFGLILLSVFLSCEGSPKDDNTEIKKEEIKMISNSSDRQENSDNGIIQDLLLAFIQDYKSYLEIEDEPASLFHFEKETYINDYFNFLTDKSVESFSHLSEGFLKQLRQYLENCSYDTPSPATVRRCAEPVFCCKDAYTYGSLKVIAIDAEEDEAVAHTLLQNINTDRTGCKTIFTLRKVENKWMIMERETESE